MNDVIDIHEHVEAICEALGLEYVAVGRLVIDPGAVSVTAKVYRLSERGHLFVDADTNDPVLEWKHFKVRT